MIQIKALELDVPLGAFHFVTGVGMTPETVSIYDNGGTEHILPIVGVFNRRRAEFDPIETYGLRLPSKDVSCGMIIPGMEIRDVTEVSVEADHDDSPMWDFCRRTLRVQTSFGISLAWLLYCDKKEWPDAY